MPVRPPPPLYATPLCPHPSIRLPPPPLTLLDGAAADVCLFDPAEKWTYDAKAGFSKSSNSPWSGQTLTGRVKTTIVDGRIVFDGQEVAKIEPDLRAWYRSNRVGFVFQSFNLLPRLTVLENVALPMLYRENSDPAANAAAAAVALERVGMSHRLDHRPSQLSGGERQRVAIARAIVGSPSIIFADEPTGNLDVKNVDRILDLLGSLIKEGITVVLVTHDLSVAENAHRIISMRAGLVHEDRSR
mgnify:CR=1 FL=1